MEGVSKTGQEKNWWKKATVYQIYPRSFKDSNGDGIGDIRGIIEKLDYIKCLGAALIWLTPMYVSPQRDNGYDIADYYQIDPVYGTMEEFELLLKEAHRRGIRIIMDMVLNHTSTEHEWFKKAVSEPDSPYRDYYFFRDPKPDGSVPNNWISRFSGPAWKKEEKSGQYYLHLFEETQADLNWENEAVRAECIKILKFWAEKGVDGFRLDVVNLLSKTPGLPDDPITGPKGDGRTHYADGPRIHEYLHLMNQEVFKPYGLVTVGEMSSTTPEECVLYTREDREELSMVFSFHHMKTDYKEGSKWTNQMFSLEKLKETQSYFQNKMEAGGGWNALFYSNHDQPRALSRFGNDTFYREESAKLLAITLFGLQGTTYIYQGEELGMRNACFETLEEYDDRESRGLLQIQTASAQKMSLKISLPCSTRIRDSSSTESSMIFLRREATVFWSRLVRSCFCMRESLGKSVFWQPAISAASGVVLRCRRDMRRERFWSPITAEAAWSRRWS